jgi:predicted GNAT family acetyltransferase
MSNESVSVSDNPSESRYEASLDGRLVGIAEYDRDGDRIVFVHTEVDGSVKGRGVGSALAASALADARTRGFEIVVECPFISAYLRRHPLDLRNPTSGEGKSGSANQR